MKQTKSRQLAKTAAFITAAQRCIKFAADTIGHYDADRLTRIKWENSLYKFARVLVGEDLLPQVAVFRAIVALPELQALDEQYCAHFALSEGSLKKELNRYIRVFHGVDGKRL